MALNCRQLLRDFLVIPGTSLYELVGPRVYVGRCPDGWKNAQPAIRIKASGGGTLEGARGYEPRMFLLCYGGNGENKTFVEAQAVWVALKDRLHRVTNKQLPRGTILSAVIEDPGDEVIDQETEWAAVGTFASALMQENL